MSAEKLYAILFMAVVLVIIIAGASYMWVTREKPAPKKRKKRTPPKAPQWEEQESGGLSIPPEVPRSVGTIKQIAQSEPELVEDVLRGWIKGNITPTAEAGKKKKRR